MDVLSIHERLDVLESALGLANPEEKGLGFLAEALKPFLPAINERPNAVNETSNDDALSRTAFTAAMVQQAKDFGYAIEELRTELKALRDEVNALKPAPQS